MGHFNIDKIELKKSRHKKTGSLLWNILNYDISFSSKGLTDQIKEQFYYELSILLESGVDIKTAMELVVSGQKKEVHKELFEKLNHEIIKGKSFSDAMIKVGKFTPYEYYSIQIGEESGKIVFVLKQLAQFFKNKITQRRQVITASTYPLIVVMTAISAILFMLKFIVPMFADIFAKNGNDLPALTMFILTLSNIVSSYFLFFIFFILALVLLIRWQRNESWYRKNSSSLLMKIPVIGEIISKIYLARFSFSMSLLISSKIPMLKALQLTEKMIEYYPIEHALFQMEQKILKGVPLHKCMDAYDIFPKRMVALVKAGEEVNTLDVFFQKLGDQLTQDVNHKASILSSLIEPVIIIFLGIIVGVILVAMYLPLFKMSAVL